MCGIAGFLANNQWQQEISFDWLSNVINRLDAEHLPSQQTLEQAVQTLQSHFDDCMSFSAHFQLIQHGSLYRQLSALAERLQQLIQLLANPEYYQLESDSNLLESVRDYHWQISMEVLKNVDRTMALLPKSAQDSSRSGHFVAWALEQVLENLDRLEVRGRDSAGITMQCLLPQDWQADQIPADQQDLWLQRQQDSHGETMSIYCHQQTDGRMLVRFTYKIANLIGKLGDNGHGLRQSIREDQLLWTVAQSVEHVGIIAHTRWASNGIINLANCHPVNASVQQDENTIMNGEAQVMTVLNGDVDNYQNLVSKVVKGQGFKLPAAIRTDVKIIPVLHRLGTNTDKPWHQRVMDAAHQMEGSMAIAMLHPDQPEQMMLAQKGSGQSLFLAQVQDGWILASEVYGLAARARRNLPLEKASHGGIQVTVHANQAPVAHLMQDGQSTPLTAEPIEIFSRDIFRGDFEYFLEKEIHEAPASVRKTLQGRYRRQRRRIDFDTGETSGLVPLIHRITHMGKPPLRRIYVTGQGTAAIAGMATAHLLKQSLARTPIHIESIKASELSAELMGDQRLDDALVIAISQSGTTTDTNRTVDLARSAGAWVHAIVNRRNSPLVRKSDSRLFTSDGRDVEMAVASTKAFYSQVVAGKLTSLCIAQTLEAMPEEEVHDEIMALEALPYRIQETLDNEQLIKDCAYRYAPFNRYWALVGNGSNKIAAEEIRIKLSELCYRSIPCDFTEDKKHIDLSTEPLTLVIANDLDHSLAQDTAKEVAIFKAHNGKPIVFCAMGEQSFSPYAEAVVPLPSAGAGLDMIIAAVAGHLWGFHAARAIDQGALPFRQLATQFGAWLDDRSQPIDRIEQNLKAALQQISEGGTDAGLPARIPARIALFYRQWLNQLNQANQKDLPDVMRQGMALMKEAYEELTRSIDSIRHQAKTVTVGISRPQKAISPAIQRLFSEWEIPATGIAERDRKLLTELSPLLSGVSGAALYQVEHQRDETALVLQKTQGVSDNIDSQYRSARAAAGSKRRCLRLGRLVLSSGRKGQESIVVLPLFDDQHWRCQYLLLVHMSLIEQCTYPQKIALLKALGHYEDAYEAFQEVAQGEQFTGFIQNLTPRDILFATSYTQMVQNWQQGGGSVA